ncbi:hypothetical protein WJX73_006107 [Symbiochloris irregularis]|uniref:Uncharacterized protein n=1 Tax=Symbiochloris irregularis TaxID=706552 RepID=A0AAW1NY21_9CHLO
MCLLKRTLIKLLARLPLSILEGSGLKLPRRHLHTNLKKGWPPLYRKPTKTNIPCSAVPLELSLRHA